ncbi:MAG: peptide ABC transporter substrate-binding protein [Candidatus Obscuribacterales bacterium]|nr:peptide ABC transporter substrate-binding protein [Candidatus Obscuribacterales bacterium]
MILLRQKEFYLKSCRNSAHFYNSLAFISTLLFAVFAMQACSNARPGPEKDTLRINLGAEPPGMDWHVNTDNTSFDVVCNMMVGLTQYKNDLSVEPSCAESWDILDNGKRYVFHIRPDVKWSDGKPVRAQDFEYAWRRLLDPKTAAPYAFFLYDVDNAFEFNTGAIKDGSRLGVRSIDDRTFEVRLKKPASYFLTLTAICASFPMRRDIVEKYGNRWTEAEHMVVNGPFYLKDWKHEYKIELAANPLYVGGMPKIKKIKMFMIPEQATAFALYENDQLDYIDNRSFPTPDVYECRNSPEYHNFPLLRNNYIGFNVTKKPFDDKRVRQAISVSLDRNIFGKILRRSEKASYTWIPEGMLGYSKNSGPTFNPELGKQLLAEAGYPDGKGFPQVSILYPTREDARLVMEAVQDQLKRNLNLHVDLQNMEWKVYLRTLRKDAPPIFRSSWGADYPDPETFANMFTSHNGNNDTKWKNAAYDKLIDQAEGEQDQSVRGALYQKADQMLCKEESVIACTYLATQNIMTKPWVKGIAINALDLQFLKDAEINNNWRP